MEPSTPRDSVKSRKEAPAGRGVGRGWGGDGGGGDLVSRRSPSEKKSSLEFAKVISKRGSSPKEAHGHFCKTANTEVRVFL